MKFRQFFFIQVSITALLLAAAVYPVAGMLAQGALPFLLIAISIGSVSGLLAFYIISTGIRKDIRMFTAYIMGSMLVKLFVGLISITVIALKFSDFSKVYVLTYFLCYFIFTGFEVFALMRNLRPFSDNGQRSKNEENSNH